MKRIGETLKNLEDVAQEQAWAKGCTHCQYGIVQAPELTGAVALYAERAIHALDGDIQFCDCRAGHMARQQLRKLVAARQAEAKQAATGSLVGAFDEMGWARAKIEVAYEMATTPTIHAAHAERVTA